MCIVAFDLETTGLSPQRDAIVELAAVRWRDGGEVDTFDALVDPGRPIPSEVIAVHGITDDMVAGQPTIDAVLPAFLAFCAADVAVAHNAPFDLGFLRMAAWQHGQAHMTTPVVDTCALARVTLPGRRSYSLQNLTTTLSPGRRQAHRALQDARDCLALYLHLLARGAQPAPPCDPLTDLPDGALLRESLETGTPLNIVYRDVSGRRTERDILPLAVEGGIVHAFCMLRQDTRRFHLERIARISRAE
jgi:DNA polymerase III epsilon subunit family exonuclease